MEVPAPHSYGQVVLGRHTGAAGIPPAVFDHWRHRARYTCRVCHVDVGFAMSAGETGISAATNRGGFHCGACHDGKTLHAGQAIFPSCSGGADVTAGPSCARCHARSDPARLRKEYGAFAATLPRTRTGQVDWVAAEADGSLRPADHLEGVSFARPKLQMKKEVPFQSRGWMEGVIIFSHSKHTVWNGCEVCHPEIFPSTSHGATKYSMLQIAAGEACGACHGKVAFAIAECERCHASR
jgi:c(7)-type cytochrome triheme protein